MKKYTVTKYQDVELRKINLRTRQAESYVVSLPVSCRLNESYENALFKRNLATIRQQRGVSHG